MDTAPPALPTVLVAAGPGPRAERFGLPEVYALIGLASFLVARFAPVLSLHYQCPVRALTGLPCPTCGMTRAFVHLAHGDLGAALAASPLGAALAAGAWVFAAADLVRAVADRPLPHVPAPLARRVVTAGAAALLVNWGYLLVRALAP